MSIKYPLLYFINEERYSKFSGLNLKVLRGVEEKAVVIQPRSLNGSISSANSPFRKSDVLLLSSPTQVIAFACKYRAPSTS